MDHIPLFGQVDAIVGYVDGRGDWASERLYTHSVASVAISNDDSPFYQTPGTNR
jgi:hypothetical protein